LTLSLVCGLVMVASICSAQTPITIPVEVPNFDFVALATTLLAVIGTIAAAAIGLGLSIWAIRWVYKLFKSMAS